MKSFSSRLTAGRRLLACEDGRLLCAPGAAARPRDRHTRASLGVVDLEARPGPAAAPGASRRPFRKPGQVLPPPRDRVGGHRARRTSAAAAPRGEW